MWRPVHTWLFRRLPVLGCSLLFAAAAPVSLAAQQRDNAPQFTPAQLEFFEKEVRPLLAKRCYSCHSAKTEKLKGGLRLDSRSLLLKGGDTGPAAIPGKPAESLMIDAINYGEVYQMPPKSKLPDREVTVLTRWVAEGLAWPAGESVAGPDSETDFDLARRKADHWCWQPIKRQRIPRVSDRAWPSHPLDNFVLHRLEREKLTPAAPADRHSLIRRASFDLIGLPPTATEVSAFIETGRMRMSHAYRV